MRGKATEVAGEKEKAMSKNYAICAISMTLLAVAVCAGPATADTITYRQGLNGYSDMIDTKLNRYNQDTSYEGQYLEVRYYAGHEDVNSLLKFEGLSLPAGQTVESAQIKIYVDNVTTTWAVDYIRLYEAKRDWATDATWNEADPTNDVAWQSAGAQGSNDRGALQSQTLMENISTNSYVTFNLSADLVQSWIDNPQTNYGVMFVANISASTVLAQTTFKSSEYTTYEERRPTLIIETVPEPTAMVLLLGGSGLLALKRSK